MDDHLYERIMEYGECDLIPRFQEEYSRCHKITACDSYEEMKDFCTALNSVGKWAGFDRVTPSSFIWEV